MSDEPKVIVAESHRPGGAYGREGRYPTGWSGNYERIPEVTEETLSAFLTSPDVEDRIAAYNFLANYQARLPEVWVVIEDPETSPNLQRNFGVDRKARGVDYAVRYHSWSAHVDRADADAWCALFQRKSDEDCDRHPWWGPQSRRKFVVIRGAGAAVGQLRQPGAEPWTAAFSR